MLRTEMEHPSALESNESVRKKWNGEIKAQVLLFAFDSEAVSLVRELPPANEEPSYTKIQTGRKNWVLNSDKDVRSRQLVLQKVMAIFFFACLMHTAQALLGK